LAVVRGCVNTDPITSWDHPRLRKVQEEWESLCETARNTPQPERAEKYGSKLDKLNEMLYRILKSNFYYGDLRRLTDTCGTLPVCTRDRSKFVNAVLSYIERTFIESGDRDNLVRLLSTRCQLRVCGYFDIEFYLAFHGKKLKDPILVLGEAFSRCEVPEVRQRLAVAVRRGFVGLGIQGKDDAEYVKNAMQWYEKEKSHVTVNEMYWKNAMFMSEDICDQQQEWYKWYEKAVASGRLELLFKKKPSEE